MTFASQFLELRAHSLSSPNQSVLLRALSQVEVWRTPRPVTGPRAEDPVDCRTAKLSLASLPEPPTVRALSPRRGRA